MSNSRKILIFAGDSLMFALASFGMLALRFGWPIPHAILKSHKTPLILLYIIWLVILYICNLYDARFARPTAQTTRNILIALSTAIVSGFLLFYLVPFPVNPKTNLVILAGIFGLLFFLWRILYFRIFRNNFKAPLAVIGTSRESLLLIEEIKINPQLGYVFVGTVSTIDEALLKTGSSGVIVYEEHLKSTDIEKLASANIRILHIREAFQNILFKIPVHLIDDFFAVQTMEKRENVLYTFISRMLEIIFAAVVLLISLPFTLVASVSILIEDGGPIFYTHYRVGLRGKKFKIIKLRSMKKNAEQNGAQWADKDDSRITRVGKIIRTTHIDEIPQMWNVLRGDIALVGPRPERPEFVSELEKEIPYYFLRQTIKPGFTGWAQIMFRYARSVMDSQQKFEYDLYYVKNRNFFLDIGILLKTVQIIFTH